MYHEDWENTYESHIPKALYGKNIKEVDGKKKVQYNLLGDMAKIWSNITQKSFMHKVGSKDSMSDLHKFVLFHLMDEIPSNLPHMNYIKILRNMKTLGGVDDIHNAAFINKLLWEHQVFHVFERLDEDSKHSIISKRTFVARQLHFGVVNLKAMKFDNIRNKLIILVDQDDIQHKRQKKLAKSMVDKDKALETFGE